MPEPQSGPQSRPQSGIEIKATAYLMLLDPGLYCVASAPGTPPPDPVTGLPGARLSPSPGHTTGQVMLSGFGADGWIGRTDEAMLVRIIGASAPILVTMYQAATGLHEAPKLQVIRLSSPTAPSLSAPAPSVPAALSEPAEAFAHIYGVGDSGGAIGEWIGERGSQRWIEGFAVQPRAAIPPEDLEYQAVLGRGWMSPWSEGGQFCGSRGMSLPILGLAIRLRGPSADTHRLALSASFVDGTQSGPVAAGEPCQVDSLAALEAFHLVIEPMPAAKSRKKR